MTRGIGPTLGRDLVFGGIFTLLRKDFAARMVPLLLQPLSSQLATHKPVESRLWPWLEPFSVRKSLKLFQLFASP